MNPALSSLQLVPIGNILGHPAFSVYVPRAVFDEYHLKAFNCTVIGEFLEITRFVVLDRGHGHGTRLLKDLDEWAKGRGLRLCLTPQPYYHTDAQSVERLVRFYERNGFVFAQEGEWCPEAMYKA